MNALHQDPVEVPYDLPISPVVPGEVVQGKYRIGALVGFGGMAAVVAAHHLELDHPVAIKFLLPQHAVQPDALRRFLAEARAAARLRSVHVARVLDVGTTQTSTGAVVPFMVMELLQGRDLDGVLQQRGRLPVSEAVEYVFQACDAVSEAHALGIIHRDLKPGNLFLTARHDRTPVIKLLDFGISKITARDRNKNEVAVTADRDMMGSPAYMSPEQIRSSKEVDPRTDIWSLGVILHELLTGQGPFYAETTADTLVRVLHSPPDAIAQRVPDVPQDLAALVARCLEKRPESRFQDVGALAAALAPFRSANPILVPADVLRVEERQADTGVSARTVHEAPRRRRIFLTSALAFGMVGLVLIAVVGFARLRRTTKPTASLPTSSAQAAPSAEDPAAATPAGEPAPAIASSATSAVADPAARKDLPGESSPAVPSATTARASAIKAAPAKPPTEKPAASGAIRHRTDW